MLKYPQHEQYRIKKLSNLVDSTRFNYFISLIIVLNAIVIGMNTYESLSLAYSQLFETANAVFFSIFVIELILRISSYAKNPLYFFKSAWNVFDFTIVALSFLPIARESSQVMRLLRLARIVRLMRFLPRSSLLMDTVRRAIPPVFTTAIFIGLVIFIFGMIGNTLFGQEIPKEWGTIGDSMRTLFVLLTLEGLPEYLEDGMEVSRLAVPFLFSYVLMASFFVLNLLIGIVVSANEQAQEHAKLEEARQKGIENQDISDDLAEVIRKLSDLEAKINLLSEKKFSN
jgi:voltage-gated sodium channel